MNDRPEHQSPDVYPWDTGETVVELQELLNAHGFRLRVDGDYGYITEAAVKAFQKQHGLRLDGIVSAKTWAILKDTVQAGTRVLRRGHSGADVRELQGLLQIQGFNVQRTGMFDRETEEALKLFQQRCRLKPHGHVTLVTWNLLRNSASLPLPRPPEQHRWFLNSRKWW